MKSQKMVASILLCFFVAARLLAADPEDDDNVDDFIDFGDDATGIVVTGTPETTAQIQVIDRESIERSSARDLAALLEEEIGMSVTRQGG